LTIYSANFYMIRSRLRGVMSSGKEFIIAI